MKKTVQKIIHNSGIIVFILFLFAWEGTSAQTIDKTGYNSGHYCYSNNSTAICQVLRKVRTQSAVNASSAADVIIQAHRGSWGGDIPENSLAAFTKSINDGIKVIEVDIMPVDVTHGGLYTNAFSGQPSGLVAFHDYLLTRLANGAYANRVYSEDLDYLSTLTLYKPRTNTFSDQKITTFSALLKLAYDNDVLLCADIKNLEANGHPPAFSTDAMNCKYWNTDERKLQSLIYNMKYAINNAPIEQLRNLVIKTYESYTTMKDKLTNPTSQNPVPLDKFNAVLWAPMYAPNSKFKDDRFTTNQSPAKIQTWFDEWFKVNNAVLYYETNIFNSFDKKSSVLLEKQYGTGVVKTDLFTYLVNKTGRRVGIFSEEPVGSRGVVNRWTDWKIKDATTDRRGDQMWLLKIPFMKSGVITTDRPDLWQNFKGNN